MTYSTDGYDPPQTFHTCAKMMSLCWWRSDCHQNITSLWCCYPRCWKYWEVLGNSKMMYTLPSSVHFPKVSVLTLNGCSTRPFSEDNRLLFGFKANIPQMLISEAGDNSTLMNFISRALDCNIRSQHTSSASFCIFLMFIVSLLLCRTSLLFHRQSVPIVKCLSEQSQALKIGLNSFWQ